MIHHGDCLDILPTLDAESIDAVVTDPPYGLEFMGKAWDKLDAGLPQEKVWKGRRGRGGSSIGDDDSGPASRHHVAFGGGKSGFKRCLVCGKRAFSGSPCKCDEPRWVVEYPDGAPSSSIRMQRWHEAWAREALRVAKPGAYLLAFGGTRTYHRLACAIEDAGWEVRDCLVWAYASGFPKSRNLSGEWQGWGTALKPAWEPIILARKPLRGTVAANVQEYGTGALNIDGCRIEGQPDRPGSTPPSDGARGTMAGPLPRVEYQQPSGRWPANIVLTDPIFDGGWDGVVGGGEATTGGDIRTARQGFAADSYMGNGGGTGTYTSYGDSGTYSRFFLIPKADRADREPVLGGLEERAARVDMQPTQKRCPRCGEAWIVGGLPRCGHGEIEYVPQANRPRANHHPTVKPTDLMRHLVRLVTPPGGTVLDPFLGSGTTALAAEMEGFGWVGIEREEEYVRIAEARLNGVQRGLGIA